MTKSEKNETLKKWGWQKEKKKRDDKKNFVLGLKLFSYFLNLQFRHYHNNCTMASTDKSLPVFLRAAAAGSIASLEKSFNAETSLTLVDAVSVNFFCTCIFFFVAVCSGKQPSYN
jgi:hypothetical protein